MELLNQVLEREPDHYLALRDRYKLHALQRKNFSASMRDVERLEVAAPWNQVARAATAELYDYFHDPFSALTEARRANELHPQDHSGSCLMGLSLQKMGRIEEEIAAFTLSDQVKELAGHDWFLSDAHYRLGQYETALVDAKNAVELMPDHFAGFWYLMDAYLALGKPAEARATLDNMLGRAETWRVPYFRVNAHWGAADALARLGEMDEALAQADRIGEFGPLSVIRPSARAEMLRGFTGIEGAASDCARFAQLPVEDLVGISPLDNLLSRGTFLRDTCRQYELAMADYDRAIEMAPWWVDPYRERAELYRLQGELEASLAELEKAIEIQPAWPDLYHDRGRVYLEQDRLDEALLEFEHLRDLDIRSDEVAWDRARTLLRLGREDEGLRILEEAIERRPRAHWLRNWLGEAFLWLGRVDEAIAAHDGAIESQPTQAEGYARRAAARLLADGSCTGVAADLQRSLELVPYAAGRPLLDDTCPAEYEMEILGRVAWVQAAYGHAQCPGALEPSRVVELARRAVAYDPRRADYQLALGMALLRTGSHEEARAAFQRSLDLRAKDDAFSLLGLAMTHRALGNTSTAQQALERARSRALETFPMYPGLRVLQDEAENRGQTF
jgi:tetratricopeptide (TPR) repeat protein